MKFRCGFGKREGHPLVVGYRFSEGLPDAGVLERALECPSPIPDRARRVVDASERDAVERRLEAFVHLAHELPSLHIHVVEPNLGFIAADVTEELDDSLHLEPGRAGRNQERRNASFAGRSGRWIGHGKDDAVVGDGCVAGPDLPPRKAPSVAVGSRESRWRPHLSRRRARTNRSTWMPRRPSSAQESVRAPRQSRARAGGWARMP